MDNKKWPIISKEELSVCNYKNPFPYLWKHSYVSYFNYDNRHLKSPLLNDAVSVIDMETKLDFGYVAIYNSHIVISIQGTNGDFRAWLENFDLFPFKPRGEVENDPRHFKKGKWGKGRIHDGFYDAWARFKPKVDDILSRYSYYFYNKPVFITGHSRGGSIAELCARHLAKNRNIPCSVITFGAPGVGNKEYRNEYRMLPINGTWARNGFDLVTYVPLRHGCATHININEKPGILRLWLPSRIRDHYQVNYDKHIMKKYI